MGVRSALDAVKNADRIVEVMRLADELAVEAGRDSGARSIRILLGAIESTDQISAIAAIHGLAGVIDKKAGDVLSELLSSERGFVREHAAWALGPRSPRPAAVGRLISLVTAGGFGGMLAQCTLERWAKAAPFFVVIGVESALLSLREPDGRSRLVETLGLVEHSTAAGPLLRIATDTNEDATVRMAAISALGDRKGDEATIEALEALIEEGGPLAEFALLAHSDLVHSDPIHSDPIHSDPVHGDVVHSDVVRNDELLRESSRGACADGLTVAQLFLHADIDPELRKVGSGDTGGVATLLVRLGDALVSRSSKTVADAPGRASGRLSVSRVLTLSRGGVSETIQSLSAIRESSVGHLYGRVPLMQEPVQAMEAWHLRVVARRGIARMLRAAGSVDVLHLRMADVGSFAAADVARDLDIPVVFTAAPDPHGVIDSLDASGKLNRQNFGSIDEGEHFWFRARLVERLAANSAHNVFFPRPNLQQDMRDLMGIDIAGEPERHTTVPEGIDLRVTDLAVREAEEHASGGAPSVALAELRTLLEGLPDERRGLPVLISVGRFHRVKGMAALAEAWAGSTLALHANLMLVGGNLGNPSRDEREQLVRIDQAVAPERRLESGLVLAGHRPNNTVVRWIAATRIGLPGCIAPGGIYVCGSVKEEFGLAILEAMASGLLLVAPDGGGPATYVEQGRTGFLTSTWDPELLRAAIEDALRCSAAETTGARAAYSRSVVRDRFTVESMAETLTEVYSDVHRDDAQLRRELEDVR